MLFSHNIFMKSFFKTPCNKWSESIVITCGLIFLLTISGCSDKPVSEIVAAGETINLNEYYPFVVGSNWGIEWTTNRGDKWQGEFRVASSTGENTYLINDIENVTNNLSSRSSYRWDSNALKHVYKVTPSGDSIVFNPPRQVLPSQISNKRAVRSSYNYSIYSSDGAMRRTGSVNQTQELIRGEDLNAPGGVWKNCVVIKTTREDVDDSGGVVTKNAAVWYAPSVGPVKMIAGIPQGSLELEGAVTGYLYTSHPEK
ncbi:hypothetical protein ACFLQV_00310 [Calditrichota bacterium]